MENSAQNPKKSIRPLDIIYPILILLLIGGCVWLYMGKETIIEERDKIIEECNDTESQRKLVVEQLSDLQTDFDALETNNTTLQAEIDSQRVHIQELLEQAEKHKDDAYIIYKLKKEAATLREIMKGYLHTIDSLNTLNITLREEKSQVERALSGEQKKVAGLETEKAALADKVKIGAQLDAINMTSFAQRVKDNGVHRPTTKAEKADKVKTCLTVSKNLVADPGKKTVYLRIQTPTGEILALGQDESNLFEYDGVSGLYSVKKVIDYQNEEQEVCLYWIVKKTLPSGRYVVTAYVDEMKIGDTAFELK